MIKLRGMVMVCLLANLPLLSFGWGPIGHRIVGQIADSYLTSKARAEINKILGTESIAIAANWADFIKSDSQYSYITTWHYIDFDPSLTKDEIQAYLAKDTAADLYTKTIYLVNQLKNKKLSLERKRMDLKLLIHLVGDMHQPFHVGRPADKGGNKIKVTWFNTASNLHSLWDEQLITFQQLSYTEYTNAINHTSSKQRLRWQNQPISEWIIESHEISEKLYSELTEPEPKLGYRYNFDHIQLLNEQLLKAGVRLAGLLNKLFG